MLVLGRPERSSSPNTQLSLKHESHSETAVWFLNDIHSLTRHLKSFGDRVTKHHVKLDADLLDLAMHCRKKTTKPKKYSNKTVC
jgi:hypothetical protein